MRWALLYTIHTMCHQRPKPTEQLTVGWDLQNHEPKCGLYLLEADFLMCLVTALVASMLVTNIVWLTQACISMWAKERLWLVEAWFFWCFSEKKNEFHSESQLLECRDGSREKPCLQARCAVDKWRQAHWSSVNSDGWSLSGKERKSGKGGKERKAPAWMTCLRGAPR